jgi:hypothetical protein
VTTAQDIVTQALKANGVGALGQTPSSADLADGLFWLQSLLAQWQRKRWMVWHLVDTAIQSTGALNYGVGTGASFNIARPDQIEGAYARLIINDNTGDGFSAGGSDVGGSDGIGGGTAPGTVTPGVLNIDYTLYMIQSMEEYAQIGIKGLQTFPGAVFYDAAFPTGKVYFYPIPSDQFELHILTKEALQQFANLTDDLMMPPEYVEALVWSLAARLRPLFGLPPDPTVTAAMNSSMQTIRIANLQIPALGMPNGLPNGSRSGDGWWWAGNYGVGPNGFTLDTSRLG